MKKVSAQALYRKLQQLVSFESGEGVFKRKSDGTEDEAFQEIRDRGLVKVLSHHYEEEFTFRLS